MRLREFLGIGSNEACGASADFNEWARFIDHFNQYLETVLCRMHFKDSHWPARFISLRLSIGVVNAWAAHSTLSWTRAPVSAGGQHPELLSLSNFLLKMNEEWSGRFQNRLEGHNRHVL